MQNFNEIIKELSLKNSMQDIDIINIFVKSAEEVFNTPLSLTNTNGEIKLIKVSNNKKITLNQNTMKKIHKVFEAKLEQTNIYIQTQRAKALLKNKTVIMFEILKNIDDFFVCSFNGLIAKLPFSHIPSVDINKYIISSKHYGIVHSYSYKKKEIILNCKHNLVETKKANSVILNFKVSRVNRYYGKRIKIYANHIPNKTIINNLRMIFPNEKIVFFMDKNLSK